MSRLLDRLVIWIAEILDRNLLTIPAPEIIKTKVLETVVNGKTVYKAQP